MQTLKTALKVSQIISAKAAGASFALSPIDPTGFVEEGFVGVSLRLGL